jgi:DNA-binding response OmpR family regulator
LALTPWSGGYLLPAEAVGGSPYLHTELCAVAGYLYRIRQAGNRLNAQVLIADSDPGLRQRLHARLLHHNVNADCVSTAPEALEKLNERPYVLVAADLGLPHGGIDHVISRISRLEPGRRPIVLILAATAEGAKGLDVDIVQIVIRRPVEIEALVALIRSCLESSSHPKRKAVVDGDGESAAQRIS